MDTNQMKSQFPDDSAERKPAVPPASPACVWEKTANAKLLQFKHLENSLTERGELQTGFQQGNVCTLQNHCICYFLKVEGDTGIHLNNSYKKFRRCHGSF
jgi:hypothetical protein